MTGVIFDFNGTMFFDEKFQEMSWKDFIRKKTGQDITDQEFQNYIHGRNADVSLPYFLKCTFSRNEIEKLEEEKEKLYRDLCLQSEDFKLADGLYGFLEVLKKSEVPITIATASGWNNVRFFFEHLCLDRWFDINKVVFNDGNIPGKPEPDLYLLAAEKLQLDIHSCVVFEDSVSGIEAARRAGAGKIIKVNSMRKPDISNDVTGVIKDYKDTDKLLAYMDISV